MVIVVMGDRESVPESVGAAIAESLGWDFLDTKKQFGSCNIGPAIEGGKAQFVELLGTVLDSSIYHWRDVVVSSPNLAERDQKHLRDNRLLVKFVQLKESACDSAKMIGPTSNHNQGTLTLASSMEMTQIIEVIVNALILRRP